MTNKTQPLLALMAAIDLPPGADVPAWVHLLPGGDGIRTFDGRGPYRVTDAAGVIAASLADPRGMLIDVNHSTDLAAPKGGEAPARVWIKSLEARADGIWAEVDWTDTGRALLADRSYRGLSPVIEHLPDGTVLRIRRASLTNVPNLQHLTALNMESSVTLEAFLARLAEKLGLPATASADALMEAIPAKANTAMQAEIGTALGVDAGNPAAVLAAVQALQASQAAHVTQAARIAALEASAKRGAADAWMAAHLNAKRGIPADKREGLIAIHMQDAAQAESIAKMYPDLGPSNLTPTPPGAGEVLTALNAEQSKLAKMLGVTPEAYLATLKAEAAAKENV